MKKCILIGGGNIGKANTPYETEKIDKEIVKLTEKINPTFLFIGLASSNSDSYYDTIKKIYQKLGCKKEYLKKSNLINNKDLVKDKIERADIIYIGGGDTIKLKESVEKYKLEELLKEAYQKGTVLVGMSAGAILLSNEGFSDSLILRNESDKNTFIKGLGFVNISICPHFQDPKKQKELKDSNKKVIGIKNNEALKIIDDNIEGVI